MARDLRGAAVDGLSDGVLLLSRCLRECVSPLFGEGPSPNDDPKSLGPRVRLPMAWVAVPAPPPAVGGGGGGEEDDEGGGDADADGDDETTATRDPADDA